MELELECEGRGVGEGLGGIREEGRAKPQAGVRGGGTCPEGGGFWGGLRPGRTGSNAQPHNPRRRRSYSSHSFPFSVPSFSISISGCLFVSFCVSLGLCVSFSQSMSLCQSLSLPPLPHDTPTFSPPSSPPLLLPPPPMTYTSNAPRGNVFTTSHFEL